MRYLKNKWILLVIVYLSVLFLLQFFISDQAVYQVKLSQALESPSIQHWLGTDEFGRDVLARLIAGAKFTLLTTLVTLLFTVVIGVPLGLLAGYRKGRTHFLIMRMLDIGLSIPEFIIMIALASFIEPSIWNLALAIALIKWMTYTRITATIVQQEMSRNYMTMNKMLNVPLRETLLTHLVPHIMPTVVVMMTVDFGKIILYISALSFLGLGAQPPSPEWGAMLNAGRSYFATHPLLLIVPALVISLTILLFNLAGDALRDKLFNRGEHKIEVD